MERGGKIVRRTNCTITKNKVLIVLMALYFLGMLAFCLIKQPEEYSISERRKLQQFPKVTTETILAGTWMTDLEDYMLDQFPFRDSMRTIKAYTSLYVFGQKDNNDIYIIDGYASEMEYPLREESLEYAGERFRFVYDTYLRDKCDNVYYSIIPDKNYFLAKESGRLVMDYDKLITKMQEQLTYMEYIDIVPCLSIEDYYRTDTHWRQENIVDVAQTISSAMGVRLEDKYQVQQLEEPFYGVYYGQAALPMKPETIRYLTNDTMNACKVYDFEHEKEIEVYDMEKATGDDPYEMFLSGPLSLLTIENPKTTTDKELIVFRDSFGSSLAPLLAEGYSKITLVDIRYMESEMLERFIDFQNQDILFLYSTQVLNNSDTLK